MLHQEYAHKKAHRRRSFIVCLLIEISHNITIAKEMALRLPLELSGALSPFQFEESTPTIGREYVDVDIVKDILDSENGDALVRDLAITGKLLETVLKLHC